MKIPTIHGYIDRRILINFTADPSVIKNSIPSPFRPQIYNGKAIVGICLIRLKNIKPKGFPDFIGVNSENGAHRIAVEWNEGNEVKTGVYIPRRDTSLKLNSLIGGRIFPGVHHYANFKVEESNDNYDIEFTSKDNTRISITAKVTDQFNTGSIFGTLDNASSFFQKGELGYSPNKGKFEGLKLRAYTWKVQPLDVTNIESSFFSDKKVFPEGSIKFDNALLMKNIEHEWNNAKNK